MSQDCRERKHGNERRYEKAEKALDNKEDDLVFCSLTMEKKKENVKKKVWFAENVKQPSETGMMCTINGDTFFYSQRIHGLETLVHHVTSQTIIPVYSTSSTSTS